MNDKTIEEIVWVIEQAKKLGVQELEMDGIRVKFKEKVSKGTIWTTNLPPAFATVPLTLPTGTSVPDVKAEEIFKPLSPLDDMTPEEILYYATPQYDVIQAEKQAHKDKLAGEQNE